MSSFLAPVCGASSPTPVSPVWLAGTGVLALDEDFERTAYERAVEAGRGFDPVSPRVSVHPWLFSDEGDVDAFRAAHRGTGLASVHVAECAA